MEYRLATLQDAASICLFTDGQLTPEREKQMISFLEKENAKAFLAVADALVGFAYGCILHRPDGKKDFYLHAVDVAENCQGQGYGTALVRFIDQWRKEAGCRKMFLITGKSNPKACRCYQKSGGKTTAEDDVVYVFE